jgi:hypothetical protein
MVALFLILFLSGAGSEPPTSSPPVTLIRCGTLIDGVSAVPRKDVLLQVEGNRIASLSTNRRAFSHESSARTIDLSTYQLPSWDRTGESQVYVRKQEAEEEQLRFDKTEKPSRLASKDNGGSVSLCPPRRCNLIGIPAAFCMYNRYVDGLATWAPQEQEAYIPMGAHMAHEGYVNPPAQKPTPHPESITA